MQHATNLQEDACRGFCVEVCDVLPQRRMQVLLPDAVGDAHACMCFRTLLSSRFTCACGIIEGCAALTGNH